MGEPELPGLAGTVVSKTSKPGFFKSSSCFDLATDTTNPMLLDGHVDAGAPTVKIVEPATGYPLNNSNAFTCSVFP